MSNDYIDRIISIKSQYQKLNIELGQLIKEMISDDDMFQLGMMICENIHDCSKSLVSIFELLDLAANKIAKQNINLKG